MSASSWVHVDDCIILKVTEKAILVFHEDWDEDKWIPKSQMDEPDKYEDGDKDITVSITAWFAEKEGIEA